MLCPLACSAPDIEDVPVYVPEHFVESSIGTLQQLVDQHPLATLVAVTADGLTANHIPLRARLAAPGTGTLRGHIARSNALWRQVHDGAEVLVIFMGADAYVSPNWYPSKREHGKVVPTWNYATVHMHGTIRFVQDTDWLHELVSELTDVNESSQPHPWKVSDAPEDYLGGMMRSIIGLEIQVSRVVGKFKGSQNRSGADRSGVSGGLRSAGRKDSEIAELAPGAAAIQRSD
jgi:transcriptional regulator